MSIKNIFLNLLRRLVMAKKILVINGPNLNLLGEREPEIYGKMSLTEINEKLKEFAQKTGENIEFYQSNF